MHLDVIACRNNADSSPPIACGHGVENLEFGPQLVPFAYFANEGAGVYCVDLKPGEGGKIGQVVEVDFVKSTAKVVANSIADLLERGLRTLEAELTRKQQGPVQVDAENQGGKQSEMKVRPLYGCALLLITVLLPKRAEWWLVGKLAGASRKPVPAPKAPGSGRPRGRKAASPGSITALWYEIEDLNREQGENIEEKFGPGATEEELIMLERGLGYRLPDDLRELFLACAACDYPWPSGAERDYGGFDVAHILDEIRVKNECLEDGELRLFPGTRAPVMGKNLIPLESGDPCLCYDLNPGPGGVKGQIVDVDLEFDSCRVVAPSLKSLLQEGLASLKRAANR